MGLLRGKKQLTWRWKSKFLVNNCLLGHLQTLRIQRGFWSLGSKFNSRDIFKNIFKIYILNIYNIFKYILKDILKNITHIFKYISGDKFLPRRVLYLNSLGSQFSSVHFSHSVVSDSLRPHESQHAKPPCLSPTPGVH